MPENRSKIGITCAYAPIQIIHAAGFTPYRILPATDSKDQAGQILHDNICPHVKMILDRVLGSDIPELSGTLFINSCDSMRRLAGAYRKTKPEAKNITVDLPSSVTQTSVTYLADQYKKIAKVLEEWGSHEITEKRLLDSIQIYNELKNLTQKLQLFFNENKIKDANRKMQGVYNLTLTHDPEIVIEAIKELLTIDEGETSNSVPVFLFGNVLPDEELFNLFDDCGAQIVDDDLCTGSRYISEIKLTGSDIFSDIAESTLLSPPCARTFDPNNPGAMAKNIFDRAGSVNAKGVVGYTLKFCDPYLARIPEIRSVLKREKIPFLQLEGDGRSGTIGQQLTRIEAFMEMLR
ncbi:MAG: 2-hydroxyacyl-CoA dehydratase [Deltaproteobacteria bacterium]|nr:2-hydroxyacyl-CoA dehydratase [Deltaproteobacteria bacterium]